MDTPALQLAETLKAQGLPERLSWGPVELQVTDLDRAVCFWTAAVGLRDRGLFANGTKTELGTSERTLIVLHKGAQHGVKSRYAGMYHVAIGLPDQPEFSRHLARLMDARVNFSPVDHTMSKAIYIHDPDGHGIEIAYETPWRFSRFVGLDHSFAMIDSKGRMRSGRDPLDIADEIATLPQAGLYEPISDRAFLAHLHLHVPAISPAVEFFERIGFARNLNLQTMGFADLGTGGAYTHRLALNTWQGEGVELAPAESARLLRYSLRTADRQLFEAARSSIQPGTAGSSIIGEDPAGVTFSLVLQENQSERQKEVA